MDKTPRISVVIPVYNAQKTLTECVGSVLQQDEADIEVILVDDGSTDRSGALCDAFAKADPRVKAIHQACIGVSSARNAGLRAAAGQYTVFLDSDDHLLPGALRTALNAQNEHPDAWILWHYATGAEREQFGNGRTLTDVRALANVYTDCLLSMPWNKLYRTDMARTVGFDEDYTLGEDLLFCLDYQQAMQLNRLCILDAALTFYNCSQSDGTLSTRYLPDYCPVWESVFTRLNRAMADCGCPEKDVQAVWRAELQVLAEGAADIMARDPAGLDARRAKAQAALRSDWVRKHLERMRAARVYSAYYRPVRAGKLDRVCRMAQSRREGSSYFGHMDWLGYYLLGGRWKRS